MTLAMKFVLNFQINSTKCDLRQSLNRTVGINFVNPYLSVGKQAIHKQECDNICSATFWPHPLSFLFFPKVNIHPIFLWFPLMRIIILNGQLFYTNGLFFEFPKVSAHERVECSSYPNLRSSARVRDWHSYV